jgi:hypothetical protein
MSDNFTYETPNAEKYLQLLLRLLKSKNEVLLYNLLKNSKCVIDQSSSYSRNRWNAYRTTIYFYVPTDNFDILDIDETTKSELIRYCDLVMPKDVGFDVMQVEVSPSLDDIEPSIGTSTLDDTFSSSFGEKGENMSLLRRIEQSKESKPCRIFISYRRNDSADVVGRIYDKLMNQFGKENVFKDVDSIPLGIDFREYLDKSVSNCNIFLAIIGTRWLEVKSSDGKRRIDDSGDFVRIEIESALQRNIPVIPVLVQNATVPTATELPLAIRQLAYRNGISVRSDPDFHNDMDRLIRGINHLLVS